MKKTLQHTLILSAIIGMGFTSVALSQTGDQQRLRNQIDDAKTNIQEQKDQYDTLADEVNALEKKLGRISTEQRKTEAKIDAIEKELAKTNSETLLLDQSLAEQTSALAQQLQAMYTAGGQSYLRLLLMQDKPSDISRTLHYYDYLNEYRTTRIQNINATRDKLKTNREKADTQRTQLSALTTELDKQEQGIQDTLSSRETKLGQMKQDIRAEERRLNKLNAQQAELNKMLAELERKRQAEQEQSTLAGRTAQQNTQDALRPERPVAPPASSNTPAPESLRDKVSPSTNADNNDTTVAETAAFSSNKPFAQLKGRLSWPTNGKILHAYRSSRNEKQRWDGVIIAARGGETVRSIAAGKVAFAGWMNGYGYLIIIEHDRNYISLYGYNRALYKRVGQIVRANEAIASVGNSGGQTQNGLYFEIRSGTTPQNPASWCH